MSTLLLAALVSGSALGCANKDTQPPSMTPEAGTAYTNEETVAIANELVSALEMPAEQQAKVLQKVERTLDDPNERPNVYEQVQAYGVTGVVAYRLGEGGAIVTVKSGKAVARLKGEQENREFNLSGTDLGAQIAASREWGVGLVLGLPEGEELEGKYSGVQKSAAAGAGRGSVTLSSKRGRHRLVLLGSGAGVSLDVSGSRLKIKPAS